MNKLSIGIVAYNEEEFLSNLFGDLVDQTYDHSLIEILLIDSNSSDRTKEIMNAFASENKGGFLRIRVFENPKRIQAAGWNVAIDNYSGDALTRIDAHTRLDKNFCKYVVEDLETGEMVVGGKRPTIIENDSKWSKTLLQAENSLFGSSLLKSRSSNKKEYVKTMFHATYRREVIERVGRFNESLVRTEDNEFHYRVAKAGYKLCYDPRIISYQFARSSFKKMLKQKFGNGFWIGKTVKCCPQCLSLYHFAPFVFLIAAVASFVLLAFNLWQFAVVLWGLYFLFALFNTFFSGIKYHFYFYHLVMPFIFLSLHLSYGIGTFIGLINFKRYGGVK